ncbi:hypothetical protein [Polyangium mundeleinium]|uniref:Uncharacterized protein n=1 Tax=Polyangium mundeleinium TaxID=2995306 RepID=A0ABT5EPE6_9BACT|nr:hypothetical protein [Polyangium mundeleinium]MDC0743715.1 hypothetical protein [Polyangium mundeleinium]
MPSFSKSAIVLLLASPLVASVIAVGCSDEPQVQTSGSGASGSGASGGIGGAGGIGGSTGGAGGIGGSTGGAGGTGNIPDAGPDGWVGPDGGFVMAACVNQVYQCGDTIDNDGDGLIDWQDPECLGPCDNSETGLGVSIPGGAGAACITDCFWDSNSGTGNDECYWNHQCDPLSTAPDYYPEWWNGNKCTYNANANTPGTNLSCDELLNNQPETCKQVCPELTPNGCDCFGCCVIYKDGQKHGPVWLGTENGLGSFSCDLEHLDDPKSCAPCTQVKGACYNECGTCELCIGKDTLPPECFPPPPDAGVDGGGGMGGTDAGTPPPEQCPDGLQPCGLPGQDPCGAGFYCITGCCIEQPK